MIGDEKVAQYYKIMDNSQRAALVRDVVYDFQQNGVPPELLRQITANVAIAIVLLSVNSVQPRDFSAWFTTWWVAINRWAYANGFEPIGLQEDDDDE